MLLITWSVTLSLSINYWKKKKTQKNLSDKRGVGFTTPTHKNHKAKQSHKRSTKGEKDCIQQTNKPKEDGDHDPALRQSPQNNYFVLHNV